MAWTDRLRDAAYTSPSGVRFPFTYGNVTKSIDKRTSAFDFPDAPGTYIQDLGHTGYRFPFRAIFWGTDCDLEADAFEAGLLESGVGKFEHPLYGVFDVVPFGSIGRRDDLRTAANQAIVQVTFWQTIGLIYPASQNDPASDVIESVEEYNEAISEELDETLVLDTAFKKVTFKNTYDALLGNANSGLSGLAETQGDVGKQYNNILDSINNGIDILVDDPITLARQTTQLIQSPARALTNIQARLNGYSNLVQNLIGTVTTGESGDFDSNEFHSKDLYASTYVTGSVVSVVNNQFATKTEAIEAAESLLNLLDDVTNWRDDNFEALDEIDTGKSYQKLQASVALAAGFLVQISFSLKQERNIVLTKDRTIIDLAAELYGTVDTDLDFLINSNNLSGSEILELKKGRSIVYYV